MAAANPPIKYFVADGFHHDCNELLSAFCQENSLKFSAFSKVWRQMKFELIFSTTKLVEELLTRIYRNNCGVNGTGKQYQNQFVHLSILLPSEGRQSLVELFEFSEEIIKIVGYHILLESADLNHRIGAVYLAYSLRLCQPTGKLPNIRIVASAAATFKELHGLLKANLPDTIDALYVFCTLLRDGVFRYVMTDRDYGVEKNFRKYFENTSWQYTSTVKESKGTEKLKSLIVPGTGQLQNLVTLAKIYHEAKCNLPEIQRMREEKNNTAQQWLSSSSDVFAFLWPRLCRQSCNSPGFLRIQFGMVFAMRDQRHFVTEHTNLYDLFYFLGSSKDVPPKELNYSNKNFEMDLIKSLQVVIDNNKEAPFEGHKHDVLLRTSQKRGTLNQRKNKPSKLPKPAIKKVRKDLMTDHLEYNPLEDIDGEETRSTDDSDIGSSSDCDNPAETISDMPVIDITDESETVEFFSV